MRLRHRILAAIAALLGAALLGMAILAWGLMQQAAGAVSGGGGAVPADPAAAARVAAAVQAASNILWLAAAAIGAVSLGIATMLVRGYVVADLEALERVITRDTEIQGSDEVVRLRARFQQLQAQVEQLGSGESAGLMAVADYRDAAAGVADQLAVADRQGLTGQVALGVAHELGGQLAVAQVALDSLPSLQGADDQADRRETMGDLQNAIERIGQILSDLNDLGLERDGAERLAEADIGAVVQRVLRLGTLHRKVRHVEISVAPPDEGQAIVAAIVPGRLEQVLLNLLINAADAMDGRGAAQIGWCLAEGQVVLQVEDAGPGVPPAERERIFEAFVSSKPADAGSGLGLSVSRRLVEAAGGKLEALDSEDLGGAMLRLTLRPV